MDVDTTTGVKVTHDAERNEAKEALLTIDATKANEFATADTVQVLTEENVNHGNATGKHSGKVGDRKSKSIYGRGLPKKGGAGGKGTWGRPGDELVQDELTDDRDPNYASDEQDDEIVYQSVKPKWNREETAKTVTPILSEYFVHAQKQEVVDSLCGLNIDDEKPMVIVCLIALAMEKKSEFRELASQLMQFCVMPSDRKEESKIHNVRELPFMTEDEIQEGFLSLRSCLAELQLDTPDAVEVLGKFMARAVFDKVLAEDIIEMYRTPQDTDDDLQNKLSYHCANEAELLLNLPHHNLKHAWGVGGGIQPLEVLKEKMTALLKEYLSSGDSEEAMRCVRDLDVPHYHHELVYETVVMAIEVSTKRVISMLVHLLKRFADTILVTLDQLTQGFVRVYTEMPDIVLDVPNAYLCLEEFIDACYDLKVISLKLKMQAPLRCRKRFVSEGERGGWKR